jgi:hypothetical protein
MLSRVPGDSLRQNCLVYERKQIACEVPAGAKKIALCRLPGDLNCKADSGQLRCQICKTRFSLPSS